MDPPNPVCCARSESHRSLTRNNHGFPSCVRVLAHRTNAATTPATPPLRAPVLPSVPGTSDEDAELEALQAEMELLGA